MMREAISITEIVMPLILAFILARPWNTTPRWALFMSGLMFAQAMDKLIEGLARGFTWGNQIQWTGYMAGFLFATVVIVITKWWNKKA